MQVWGRRRKCIAPTAAICFRRNTPIARNAAEKFIKYLTSEEGLALYLEDNTSPQIAVRQSQADLSVSMFDESHDMKLFNTGLEYAGYIDLTETFADQQTIIGQCFDEIWHNDADIKSTLDGMVDQLNSLLAQ